MTISMMMIINGLILFLFCPLLELLLPTNVIVGGFVLFFFCLFLEFVWPYNNNMYNIYQHLFIDDGEEIKPDRDT